MSDSANPAKPAIGLGAVVNHPIFGRGKIVSYEGPDYVVLFKGGETKRVAYTFDAMKPETSAGDVETERIKHAMREVLGDYGWLDVDLELGKRWTGGTLKLIPGKEDTQSKEVPIEMFFKKIIGIRDKLRVLEQKVNAHPGLTPEDKIEMEGYITRCYGSLTTFNALFASKESQFRGQSEKE
jgi:hypothetical protein